MVNFKKKTKKRVVKTKKMTYKKVSLNKIIDKRIAVKTENKSVQYWNTGFGVVPSVNAGWASSQIPMTPYPGYLVINQGVGAGGRVGNQILIKKLTFSGNLYQLPYNGTSNPTPFPFHVKFWFYYDKTDPNIIPAPQTDFLQNGSSSRGMFNDLVDLWAPVNTDKYRVLLTKQFKIGYAQNTGTGSVVGQAYGANNDYKYNHHFNIDLTKYIVKNVKFNDNTAQPSARGLFLLTTVVQANGTPYSASVIPCQMQYVLNCEYEDA